MREILFRGKRVDNGEWVEGFYVNVPEHYKQEMSGKSYIVLILLIPLLTRKGSKTKTYAICQNCGYKWRA